MPISFNSDRDTVSLPGFIDVNVNPLFKKLNRLSQLVFKLSSVNYNYGKYSLSH